MSTKRQTQASRVESVYKMRAKSTNFSSKTLTASLLAEIFGKIEETAKSRGELSLSIRKDLKILSESKSSSDLFGALARTFDSLGSDTLFVSNVNKFGDLQKFIEDNRASFSRITEEFIALPLRESSDEENELMKAEKKRLEQLEKKKPEEFEAAAQEVLTILGAITQKNELRFLQKISEFSGQYISQLEASLQKAREFQASLDTEKEKIKNELTEYENQIKKAKKKQPGASATENVEKGPSVFASNLADLVSREKSDFPRFLQSALLYIEKNALEVQGIFRIGAVKDDLQYWQEKIDNDDYDVDKINDPHIVAGLIKKFLRALPEPLFPFELFDHFVKASTISDLDEQLAEIKHLLKRLPKVNKLVLYALMFVCSKIAAKNTVNFMTPNNLAIVICPNVLYSKESTHLSLVEDISSTQNIFGTIIEHFETLFDHDLFEVTIVGNVDRLKEIISNVDKKELLDWRDTSNEDYHTCLHKVALSGRFEAVKLISDLLPELLSVPDKSGKLAIELINNRIGASSFYSQIVTLLEEAKRNYRPSWKATKIQPDLKSRSSSLLPIKEALEAMDKTETQTQTTQQSENQDQRLAIQPFSTYISTEIPAIKSAFSVINVNEISQLAFDLVLCACQNPISSTEVQKHLRSALAVFKNMQTTCRTFCDSYEGEKEKKEILNLALTLQASVRVLLACVKTLSGNQDETIKKGFVDACKSVIEPLVKLVAVCESALVEIVNSCFTKLQTESETLVKLASTVNPDLDNFQKLLRSIATNFIKLNQLGKIRVSSTGPIQIHNNLKVNLEELQKLYENLFNVAKQTIKNASFSSRSIEPLNAVTASLNEKLNEFKSLFVESGNSINESEEENGISVNKIREQFEILNQLSPNVATTLQPFINSIGSIENYSNLTNNEIMNLSISLIGPHGSVGSIVSKLVESKLFASSLVDDLTAHCQSRLKIASATRFVGLQDPQFTFSIALRELSNYLELITQIIQ
eukprot:TRINITY_DN3391_c3_g1_i1.p1 TRINITY_DN3391_c3_g1~~TRINITY_DN3391_c3_g1_i1.p1  ORF type:complete len:984 (+),score=447.10 TRINITY_DN3391_c3_g1_i1:118-3069(+)